MPTCTVLCDEAVGAGEAICVAVRPEKITISREAARRQRSQRREGHRARSRLLRRQSLYRVRLQSGAVLQVSAQNLRRSAKLTVEWDDEVYLSWEVASTILLRVMSNASATTTGIGYARAGCAGR